MQGIDELLKNLPQLLKEREEALEERERERELELERRRSRLEQEYPSHGGPSDVLRLNIGGSARVDVLRRTLTQFQGSLLEVKFSGRWDDSLEKDADGNYFIDQPEEWFLPLIRFLRSKQCETPLSLVTQPPKLLNKDDQDGFNRMIEYYGLTLAVYPIGVYQLDRKVAVVGNWIQGMADAPCKLQSSVWSTFCLRPRTLHSRFVRNYEVTLEQNTIAQIGWIHLNLNYIINYFATEAGRGVGYAGNSLCLDCTKSSIASSGVVTSLESFKSITVNDGTIIRSEDGGLKWFVDGTIVAQSCNQGDDGVYVKVNYRASKDWVPCISIKGRCEISVLELSND